MIQSLVGCQHNSPRVTDSTAEQSIVSLKAPSDLRCTNISSAPHVAVVNIDSEVFGNRTDLRCPLHYQSGRHND